MFKVWRQVAGVPAFLNIIDVIMGARRPKWRYKMHEISNAKFVFLRF